MIEKPSTTDYSDDDAKLELSLHGEGMGQLDDYEQFLAARQALCSTVVDAMHGEGGSMEANQSYIQQLLRETSEVYAHIVQSAEDDDQQSIANSLIAQSVDELNAMVVALRTPVQAVNSDAEGLAEHIEEILSDDDQEQQVRSLEELCGNVHQSVFNALLRHASKNKVDEQKQRRDKLTGYCRSVASDVGKIAVGAAAAVIATRLLDRRQK